MCVKKPKAEAHAYGIVYYNIAKKGEKQKTLDTYRKHFISIFDKNFSKYLFVKIFEKKNFFY